MAITAAKRILRWHRGKGAASTSPWGPRPDSSVAVLAPHGGAIEAGTSEIACAVAGSEFNLYVFEGIRESGNYAALHLTSHRFDEPRCLALLSACDHVITVHGCRGEIPRVLLGGLDG